MNREEARACAVVCARRTGLPWCIWEFVGSRPGVGITERPGEHRVRAAAAPDLDERYAMIEQVDPPATK